KFARQCSHTSRACGVSRSSSLKPYCSANRFAPSPTRKMWFVYLSTSFATSEGVLIPSSAPTAPARLVGPCMHAASSCTALGVGQAAVAHRVVVRVELLDLHPFDHRVEGVRPLEQHVERLLHGPQPVRARDRDGLRRPPARGRERLRRPHRERDIAGPRGRHADGGGSEELTARQQVGHRKTPGGMRVRRLRRRAAPVNLLPVDFADPPSLRGVVRGILGVAMALAGLALVVVSIGAGHIEWRLAALVLALWSAWGFFDSLFGWVLEPLGRFVGNALTGGVMPGGTAITIQDETVMLERLVDADPPLPRHRVVLAGIRLAEIYRTHEHDAAKAEAVIARLI